MAETMIKIQNELPFMDYPGFETFDFGFLLLFRPCGKFRF